MLSSTRIIVSCDGVLVVYLLCICCVLVADGRSAQGSLVVLSMWLRMMEDDGG